MLTAGPLNRAAAVLLGRAMRDPKNLTFTLLVFTLNEIEGMKAIMPLVDPAWCDQILVIDGGSTDGTVEYAHECGYDVVIQSRRGPRFAHLDAVPHCKGDIVICFSPDGNSVPEAIPPLMDKMREGYDMVIVSRYLEGAKSDDDTPLSAFGNSSFTWLINKLHGGSYTDALVLYRAWRKELYYELGLDQDRPYTTPERLFRTVISIEPLLSVRAARRGCKLGEIPGDEPARIGGVAKLQPFKWGASYLYQVLREVLR